MYRGQVDGVNDIRERSPCFPVAPKTAAMRDMVKMTSLRKLVLRQRSYIRLNSSEALTEGVLPYNVGLEMG